MLKLPVLKTVQSILHRIVPLFGVYAYVNTRKRPLIPTKGQDIYIPMSAVPVLPSEHKILFLSI